MNWPPDRLTGNIVWCGWQVRLSFFSVSLEEYSMQHFVRLIDGHSCSFIEEQDRCTFNTGITSSVKNKSFRFCYTNFQTGREHKAVSQIFFRRLYCPLLWSQAVGKVSDKWLWSPLSTQWNTSVGSGRAKCVRPSFLYPDNHSSSWQNSISFLSGQLCGSTCTQLTDLWGPKSGTKQKEQVLPMLTTTLSEPWDPVDDEPVPRHFQANDKPLEACSDRIWVSIHVIWILLIIQLGTPYDSRFKYC
jgi:hypothetical protein